VPAYAFSGYIYGKFGTKPALISSFLIGITGSIPYMILDTDNLVLNSILILAAKFGISGAFNIAFLVNSVYYPAVLASTAFGVCNLFARLISVTSPLIAELEPPIPMLSFTITSIIAAVASFFLITPK
jgi:hypothetical protein